MTDKRISISSKKIKFPQIEISHEEDHFEEKSRSKTVKDKVIPSILSPSDKYARIGNQAKQYYFEYTRSPDDVDDTSQNKGEAI